MDSRQLRKAKRQRFAEVLTEYCQHHNLRDGDLAQLLGKPRSTVTRWRTAHSSPPATDLPSICSKLNINYKLLFSENMVRGLFYETQVLSFEAMQLRYLDIRSEDPMAAFDYVTIAGAMVFNHLTRQAIECTLQVQSDLSVWIKFVVPVLRNLVLTVSPSGEKGIGLTLVNQEAVPKLAWTYLSQSSMDSLIGFLHSETQA